MVGVAKAGCGLAKAIYFWHLDEYVGPMSTSLGFSRYAELRSDNATLPAGQVHEDDDLWDADMLFTNVASELHQEKEKAEGVTEEVTQPDGI